MFIKVGVYNGAYDIFIRISLCGLEVKNVYLIAYNNVKAEKPRFHDRVRPV